ncbi:glutamate 5-kinase [Allohahella marinimesophila]|uniref:Glutamate 5-kinase n=1 Tax=Allohahella marinimesophila TaxID=1054972 RepID=A0ABP7PTN0_9GAMM
MRPDSSASARYSVEQSREARAGLVGAQRVVVKIGSALLTRDGAGLDREALAPWVDQMNALDPSVVVVSSGSVAEGMLRLGWKTRPQQLHELQAAAAIGQMGLAQAWETEFKRHNRLTAQVLLTHDDLSNRRRYLNARTTLRTLTRLGVTPVINENDTTATDEIRFGDNDRLAALVANLVEADLLIILTDQLGMFTDNPNTNPNASLISFAHASDTGLDAMVTGPGGLLGRGGMQTKLAAARLAARSGTSTVIASGRVDRVLERVLAGEEIGSLLVSDKERLLARKQWLAGHLQTRGKLTLDAGAVRVLVEQGRSLLAVGVSKVQGTFDSGDMVLCCNEQGAEIARGLINYSSAEATKIAGHSSAKIAELLGYTYAPELIHRDNLVLTDISAQTL